MVTSYNPIPGLKEQHPNLDFHNSIYNGNLIPIEFECKIHPGEKQFRTPKSMKLGAGCESCKRESLRNRYSTTQDSFIEKLRVLYGDSVGYEKVYYVNSDTNVILVCPEHGDFSVRPTILLNKKQGVPACTKCSKLSSGRKLALTQTIFLERLNEIHGGSVQLCKGSTYHNYNTEVEVNCTTCGHVWEVTPINLIGGESGCPRCAGNTRLTLDRIIEAARRTQKTPDQFDYSLVDTSNLSRHGKITLVCKHHPDTPFLQETGDHMRGVGCSVCSGKLRKDIPSLVKGIEEKFGVGVITCISDTYTNNHAYYDFVCTANGHAFKSTANNILRRDRTNACPVCQGSNQQAELVEFIKRLGVEITVNDRTLISPLELDIVIPNLRIAIEYNGVYFHSDAFNNGFADTTAHKDPKARHLHKTLLCAEKEYRLIHIFEDEWVHKKDLVKNKLTHILNANFRKVYARLTTVGVVDFNNSTEFFNKNHLQGVAKGASVTYGLYSNGELVACMSFCKPRFNKSNDVEILRYATTMSVVGGFSKLLKHFIRANPTVTSVVSYSDKRWSVGGVYKKAGFTLSGSSSPGYFYVDNTSNRYNRMLFMKSKLSGKLKKFDPSLSEADNCRNNGLYRIWDCGMDVWELKLNTPSLS